MAVRPGDQSGGDWERRVEPHKFIEHGNLYPAPDRACGAGAGGEQRENVRGTGGAGGRPLNSVAGQAMVRRAGVRGEHRGAGLGGGKREAARQQPARAPR